MIRARYGLLLAMASIGFGQGVPRKVEVSSVRASEFPSASFFTGYSSFAGQCGLLVPLNVLGNRVVVKPTSLCSYIREAYQLEGNRMIGIPRAMSETSPKNFFDIEIKAEGDATLTRDDARALLRQVLAERFHLTFHWEKKKVRAYGLHVAKDRPKLSMDRLANCDAQAISLAEARRAQVLVSCQPTITMVHFAEQLTLRFNGEPRVVDRTGLAGEYAFILRWSTEDNGPYPSIFTSIQEQLGLKLVEENEETDVMVVDRLAYPDPN